MYPVFTVVRIENTFLLHLCMFSAQAFHGAFEDFVTWLRETERRIQRDDPLKLEEEELKKGLTHLKV